MTLKEFLSENDRFAACNGCALTELREGFAKAEMTVMPNHINGGGVCQGGALFTLADLALAAVMNSHGNLTLGVESTITFLKSAKQGDHLVAEAIEVKNHHKMPYAEVKIYNEHRELLCAFTGIGYRKETVIPFSELM
jgi:acyl-CoA thioesterase